MMEQKGTKSINYLNEEYQTFNQMRTSHSNIFSQTHFELVHKIDDMMNSHMEVENLKKCFSDLVSFGKYSLTSDVQKVLKGFDEHLNEILGCVTRNVKPYESCLKHKEELLDAIVLDLLEQTYATFHENLAILIGKFVGSKGTDRDSSLLKKQQKQMKKSNKITNDAVRSLLEPSKVVDENKAVNDERISFVSRWKKIKAVTENVETFKKLAKFDFALDEREMEAIAEILNLELIVNFEGNNLTFGSSKNIFEVPGRFLYDDKLELKLTIKEIYRILKPKLRKNVSDSNIEYDTLMEFRNKISKKNDENSKEMKMFVYPHIKNLGITGS